MKKIICTLLALSFLSLSACNTIEGMGTDLQKAGKAVSESAKKAKN